MSNDHRGDEPAKPVRLEDYTPYAPHIESMLRHAREILTSERDLTPLTLLYVPEPPGFSVVIVPMLDVHAKNDYWRGVREAAHAQGAVVSAHLCDAWMLVAERDEPRPFDLGETPGSVEALVATVEVPGFTLISKTVYERLENAPRIGDLAPWEAFPIQDFSGRSSRVLPTNQEASR